MSPPKCVVLVGGGLSMKHAAEKLVKHKELTVICVQANAFVEWPLAMTYVLANPHHHSKAVASDCAKYEVPDARYIYDVVKTVDKVERLVSFLGKSTPVQYDALVVATGFSIPLINPGLGVSLEDRLKEVQTAGERIRDANTVVINGGGLVALEMAGDIRCAYADKKIILLTRRGNVVEQYSAATQEAVKKGLQQMKIDLVKGAVTDTTYQLSRGVLQVEGGAPIKYDVFLPCYSTGPNTGFLSEGAADDVLDQKGKLRVNDFLQSSGHPAIFGIGVTDRDEGFIGLPKLEGQWNTVSCNVQRYLSGGGQLTPHKQGAPFMRAAPAILIGRGPRGWAMLDFQQMPPPMKVCCCNGYAGWPFCPPCCSCCCLCPCGYCGSPPQGSGPSKCFGMLLWQFPGQHFKGFGETDGAKGAPTQKVMT